MLARRPPAAAARPRRGDRRPTASPSASPRRRRWRPASPATASPSPPPAGARFSRDQANLLSRTIALPIIVGATALKGARLARRGTTPELRRSLAVGVAASFASTLASQRLIGLVERDRALWPYAAYRVGLAAAVLAKLAQASDERRLRQSRGRPGGGRLGGRRAGPGARRDPARPALAAGAAARPLRERDQARRADRDRALHRRGRDQAAGRRGAGALRHGRDRLRGDERQRRDLRRRRAAGDARLHRREKAEPAVCEEIGVGLARGAELAGVEIPGGELAQLGDLVRGVDVSGACFGTVALDAIVDGSAVRAGRRRDRPALLRHPLQRLHARPLRPRRASPSTTTALGRPLGDVLLEPTEIYVKPVARAAALRRSRCAASPTSPPAALGNLLRLAAEVGYEIDDPLPVPPIFELIQERGDVSDEEMYEVFNMGCGFCVVVPTSDEAAALELLRAPLPGGEADRSRNVEGRAQIGPPPERRPDGGRRTVRRRLRPQSRITCAPR